MKTLIPLYLSLVLGLSAQEESGPDREALISSLMEARDEASFNAAYLAGSKAGLPEQTLIEARFLFLVDEGNQAALAAYAPVLQKQLPKFSVDDSTIFSVKEDFAGVVEYVLALDALEKKNDDLFKKHITEAFWLSPAQAGLFEPLITENRLKKAMAGLTLDLGERLEDQTKPGTQTSIKEIMGEAKATLLHFWSPWVQQSIEGMPDYSEVATMLERNGVPAISILLTGTEDSRKDADTFLKDAGGDLPGRWLVDREKRSLVSTFRVQNFPVVVLLSSEGKVLFNGSPGNPVLWEKLKTINPEISRPAAPSPLPDLESIDEKLPPEKDGK